VGEPPTTGSGRNMCSRAGRARVRSTVYTPQSSTQWNGLCIMKQSSQACKIRPNNMSTATERWVAWDEGRSFTYEGSGIPLMQRAVNRWSVISQGERAGLTSEVEVTIKGGMFEKILEPILGPLMRRMAPNALAGFKYLVEHGHPYDGKTSDLPRAPATC